MAKAVEPRRRTGMVAGRHDLHGRNLSRQGQADLRHGASLDDPNKLFNSSLDGGTRRAIDFHEGDKVDEAALKDLVRDAVAFNATKPNR